jgi:hypothetical protein
MMVKRNFILNIRYRINSIILKFGPVQRVDLESSQFKIKIKPRDDPVKTRNPNLEPDLKTMINNRIYQVSKPRSIYELFKISIIIKQFILN